MSLSQALEQRTSKSELLQWSKANIAKENQDQVETFINALSAGADGSCRLHDVFKLAMEFASKPQPRIRLDSAVARQVDINGDNVVTEDELKMKYSGLFDEETARLAQIAKAADLDGDGNVTDEELQKKYGDRTTAQKAQEELNALLAKRYIQLADEDKDGAITSEELMRIEQRVEEHLREEQKREEERRKQQRISEIPVEDKDALLAEHHEKMTDMHENQQQDRERKEAELQKRLASRRRRKAALQHMRTDSISTTQIDAAKELLRKIISEAEADGMVDEEEQREIQNARDALNKVAAAS